MIYEQVLKYVKDKVNQAGPFKEVEKPFDQSIPSTVIDRSYSIVLERVSGINRNMVDFHCIASVFVNLYRKGFINEYKAREAALIDSEQIVNSMMKVVNSNTQPLIKNVKMRTIDINGVEGNDNLVLSKINFDISFRYNVNN